MAEKPFGVNTAQAAASPAWSEAATLARRYVAALLNVAPFGVVLSVALMVCVGVSEGIGVLLLVPLLQLVGVAVDGGTTGRIAAVLESAFRTVGLRPDLVNVLAAYVLIVTVQSLLQRWQAQVNAGLEHRFVFELRQRLYRAVVNARWSFLSRSRSTDLSHALTDELGRVGGATNQFLSLVSQVVLALMYTALAFRLSAPMTAAVLFAGTILVLLLSRGARISQALGKELSNATRDMYSTIGESMGALKTTKSYGEADRNIALFAAVSERVRHALNNAVAAYANVRLGLSVGSVLVLSVVLFVGIRVLSLPPAEIMLLVLIFGRLMPRISAVQQSLQYFIGGLPAFAGVVTTIERCERAAEPPSSREIGIALRREVRLESVTFGYDSGTAPPTLHDLTLAVPARQTTALVGPSGAGKTTIADLIMGLLEPVQGQIRVDGTPLGAERLRAWREQIGYVPQETFLFHDTIRSNLLWACHDATDEAIWESLRLAVADAFVSRLPEGLETVLGDRGVRLSGGERQRLALARALLRRPTLLILDEATSALDSESERCIQEAIAELHGQLTILVITHRLSSVREADVIHMLENGRLVETGGWSELLAQHGGRFRAFWLAQSVPS